MPKGTGKFKAARKYENPIEFIESHKLWLDRNFLPVVRGYDEAVWMVRPSVVHWPLHIRPLLRPALPGGQSASQRVKAEVDRVQGRAGSGPRGSRQPGEAPDIGDRVRPVCRALIGPLRGVTGSRQG